MNRLSSTCPLCNGASHQHLYTAVDSHYGIQGQFEIVRCADCSLVFLSPMLSDEELSELYPSDYYAYQDNFEASRWKELARRMLGYKVATKDPVLEKPGTFLDLGCGSGWFLRLMRDRGWETYGVEINASAARLGREVAGLNIFSGALQQANFPANYFDYIRSNHAFEHISCPIETLVEIHRILKPSGKLLLGVPNIDSFTGRLFKHYWWYLGAPVHPFNYSVRTLIGFLKKTNFVAERIVYNSDYFGVLGSLQIWLNRDNQRKSTEGWLVNNPLLHVVSQWLANFIDLARQGDCIEMTASKV